MKKVNNKIAAAIAVSLLAFQVLPAYADSISPRIKKGTKQYSSERPESSFYGTGPAGRLTEASNLRFLAEKELADSNIDEALRVAGKAVQLDPGDPGSHLLYARALTAKFYSNEDEKVDEKMLAKCYDEWMLIYRHDSDQEEQQEARVQAKRLAKIAKGLAKKKELEEKNRKEAIAEVQKQEKK
ncbi:MAG: hypothetical protein K2Y22_16280 [Candidatus Obscuribacterales bacterium]|nr:hypothetical protein [Candidatus Obscuribacterales bacterium]